MTPASKSLLGSGEKSPVDFVLLWVGSGSPESSLDWSGTSFFPVCLSTGLCLRVSFSLGDRSFFLFSKIILTA